MDEFGNEVVQVTISYYPPEDGPQGYLADEVRVRKNLSMNDISELLLWLDSKGC
jgi:hypothetical protein